jgi:hypothetical protein
LLLGGVGLGLTSTPVTNTTTGSVPSNRSGMASGIDMSARWVTLAINISLMGLLLAVGSVDGLRERLAGQLPEPQIRTLAAHVANGDELAELRQLFPRLTPLDSAGILVRSALTQGYGLVTLYGGIAVWVIVTASLITFADLSRQIDPTGPTCRGYLPRQVERWAPQPPGPERVAARHLGQSCEKPLVKRGAGGRGRTDDLPLTRRVLYH